MPCSKEEQHQKNFGDPRKRGSVWSSVQPPNCRKSCNFCRKSGNFCRNLSQIGEKKLRKVQKNGFSKKPQKWCESSKILPNLEKILRSNDPENEISSQNFGSPRGGGVQISAKIAEKVYTASCSDFALKISKVRKIEFLQFLQEFQPPPPSGRATILRRKFIFGVVRPPNFL